jgi:hypothetical protein
MTITQGDGERSSRRPVRSGFVISTDGVRTGATSTLIPDTFLLYLVVLVEVIGVENGGIGQMVRQTSKTYYPTPYLNTSIHHIGKSRQRE